MPQILAPSAIARLCSDPCASTPASKLHLYVWAFLTEPFLQHQNIGCSLQSQVCFGAPRHLTCDMASATCYAAVADLSRSIYRTPCRVRRPATQKLQLL